MGEQGKNIEVTLMVGQIDAWEIFLNIFYPLNFDLNAAHPKDHFGPGDGDIGMHHSAIPVKGRKKETPETENYRMNGNKGIQAQKSQHKKTLFSPIFKDQRLYGATLFSVKIIDILISLCYKIL